MKYNTKKIGLATLSLIAGTSLLHAADEARLRNIENRVTSLEGSQNNCCMVNPPARAFAPECWGFYLTVEPLLWQGHVNGLPIGIKTDEGTSFFNSEKRSHVRNLDFDWDWGVRAGVGFNTDFDAWDIYLRWTYWKSEAHEHVTTNKDQAIFPTVGHPSRFINQFARHAEAKWHVRYNLVDLELGRDFFVSRYLSLRPFAGLRSAWIRQDFNTEFNDLSPVNHPKTLETQEREIRERDKMWGIGIRGGADIQWRLGCNWSLFSNFAGNVMYSYHSLKYRENGTPNFLDADFKVGNFYHVGNVILDSQLGIRWDWMSCDECIHFGIDLGWEDHWHQGQNQFMVFVDDGMDGKFIANQGDLGIQGFFLKARLDF